MAETQKQEWSKERIQAEMKDLKSAAEIRLGLGLGFMVPALAGIVGGVLWWGAGVGAVGAAFVIFGIVCGLVSILLLRSFLAKRRQYNDLKRKL
ncbi:hypothetical protein M1N66_03280 [Thermodesulfovibrionales bacterium]|nr:hypothetical protein [Thermodesulfovibrionales bacterium]